MLFREVGRFAYYFLCITYNGIVIRMLLRQFVENSDSDFLFVVQRRFVGIRKVFPVKRERGFVDGFLRLRQISLSALHDLFHGKLGSESKVQFLAKLVSTDAKIAVGARKQILL